MPDLIIGISVLQPTWIDKVYRLWFQAQKADGAKNQGWIFAVDSTSASTLTKMPEYPDGCNSIWHFTRQGDTLNCSPSVNWISWGFHNAGSWTTRYVEMTIAEQSMSKAGDDTGEVPTRLRIGHTVHYDLNNGAADPQQVIAEYRQKGVLK
jgi:hypothetical protein